MNITVTWSFTMFSLNCVASCIIYQMSTVAVQEMFQHSTPHTPDKPVQTFLKKIRPMYRPSICSPFPLLSCCSAFNLLFNEEGRGYHIQNYPSKLPLPLLTDQFRLTLAIDQEARNHRKGCSDTARGTKECRE